MNTSAVPTLTQETLAEGVRFLIMQDSDLARIFKKYGNPPLWSREPGFATLLYIILEQQVSLASARAAYQRTVQYISPLVPTQFLQTNDELLKKIGFSRQKIKYVRNLAMTIESGQLDLTNLAFLAEADIRQQLGQIKGIGPWTIDIYLMEALLQPDIWPIGDLALGTAIQQVKRLPVRPTPGEIERLGLPWKPWRAVAARMFWHYYLSKSK